MFIIVAMINEKKLNEMGYALDWTTGEVKRLEIESV